MKAMRMDDLPRSITRGMTDPRARPCCQGSRRFDKGHTRGGAGRLSDDPGRLRIRPSMRVLLAKASFLSSTNTSIVAPLGLLYLAGYLRRERPGDEVRIIDLNVSSESEFAEMLARW